MHIHIIGIGGIGLSGLARLYAKAGHTISGSDLHDSELIHKLQNEGMDIWIGSFGERLPKNTELVVFSGAVPATDAERSEAKKRGILELSYNEALAEMANAKRLIAVSGSHGKSTTTAMLATALLGTKEEASVVVGTQVPQLGNSNAHPAKWENMVIEACEYRKHFHVYHPAITLITNIDFDHPDAFVDEADYVKAFQKFVDQTKEVIVFRGDDKLSNTLNFTGKKYLQVFDGYFIDQDGVREEIGAMTLKVPGKHLIKDAELAYATLRYLGISATDSRNGLENYQGCWRRSEIVKTTEHGNILMSDYGHHPTEIAATLEAIADRYSDKRLVVVFQPHQFARTRGLLKEFWECFSRAHELMVADVYFSRDSEEDIAYLTKERLTEAFQRGKKDAKVGGNLEKATAWAKEMDEKFAGNAVILLLGAGDVDELRKRI